MGMILTNYPYFLGILALFAAFFLQKYLHVIDILRIFAT